jgi:hypothetical protein
MNSASVINKKYKKTVRERGSGLCFIQSRQSPKLFLKSSDLGLPQPLTLKRVCPPPPPVLGGGAHSLAREGLGESQFRRGDIHCAWYSLYVRTLWCVKYTKSVGDGAERVRGVERNLHTSYCTYTVCLTARIHILRGGGMVRPPNWTSSKPFRWSMRVMSHLVQKMLLPLPPPPQAENRFE